MRHDATQQVIKVLESLNQVVQNMDARITVLESRLILMEAAVESRVKAIEEAYIEDKLIGTKETKEDEQSPEARK